MYKKLIINILYFNLYMYYNYKHIENFSNTFTPEEYNKQIYAIKVIIDQTINSINTIYMNLKLLINTKTTLYTEQLQELKNKIKVCENYINYISTYINPTNKYIKTKRFKNREYYS